MKKKQLLVFIMAGSLAAGMSPVTMAFAEADTQTVTIEDIVAVAAESEEGEVYLYRYSETEDGTPVLDNIVDDDEYEIVADAFDEMLDDQEYDELVSEEDLDD